MSQDLQSRYRAWRLNPSKDLVLTRLLATRFSGILDRVPGAVAGYSSVRPLRRAWLDEPFLTARKGTGTGAVEQDFTSAEVFGGPLEAWSDGGDAFVARSYDVTGNGLHVTQETQGNQPRIVNAGVLDIGFVCNGQFPNLALSAGNMPTNLFPTAGRQWTLIETSRIAAATAAAGGYIAGVAAPGNPSPTSNGIITYGSSSARRPRCFLRGTSTDNTIASLDRWNGTALRWDGSVAQIIVNGGSPVTQTVGTNAEATQPFFIGVFLVGVVGEVIVFDRALSNEEILTIQQNQAAYYGYTLP